MQTTFDSQPPRERTDGDGKQIRDGCPGTESPDEVAARADELLIRIRGARADVLLFSSGHFLRLLAARWLGLAPAGGRYLPATASLSALGYEHNRSQPVIRLAHERMSP